MRKQRPEQKEPPMQLATPTPEQIAKGGYERPTGRGTVAVYTNRYQNVIGRMLQRGLLTKPQAAAGYAFERTWGIVNGGVSPSRDSTVPGVGGTIHESDDRIAYIAKADGRLKVILQKLGPKWYSIMVSACCFGEVNITDEVCAGLRDALELCAKVYGIGREDDDDI